MARAHAVAPDGAAERPGARVRREVRRDQGYEGLLADLVAREAPVTVLVPDAGVHQPGSDLVAARPETPAWDIRMVREHVRGLGLNISIFRTVSSPMAYGS